MAKKIVLIVVGAVLLVWGLIALVPGSLLVRATRHGDIGTGFHVIGSPTPALVSGTENLPSAADVATLRVRARNAPQPVFLGVAPAADVNRYLSGVAYDEVTNFQVRPYRVGTTRHGGVPFAEPPGAQTFWVASATGTSPTLEWPVQSGDYRLVMMNADGSPGTAADTELGVQINGLRPLGVGLLIGGGVFVVVGLGLLLWGIRLPGRPLTPPAPMAPPSAPPA